ncbi:MAG: ankyrin repeat domain-containing protein [Nitriliruptoraceae bacterium]
MADISALLQAAYNGDRDEVERLRATVGVGDVFDASAVGDVDAVERFLDTEPAAARVVAVDGFTALHLAAYFARDAVVQILLDAGADPDAVADNGTDLRPLHAATAAASSTIVAALLTAGASADARQRGGFTPLMAAAKHGDTEGVQLLLAAGADADRAADDGSTARSLADPTVRHLLD